tara:strand:- start:1678 stop:1914 length:237 start_codon:yes stop_codon:yes gene_type:complete
MKPGDLFTFDKSAGDFKSQTMSWSSWPAGKSGIFLGERPLTRNDGKVIPNFAVQFFGETTQRLLDTGMKHYLRPLETN